MSTYTEVSNFQKTVRFLAHPVVRSVSFRCSRDYAKRSFHCAANANFAKVGRLSSGKVILQLVVLRKDVPMLFYGLEVCALPTRTLLSLDFI